MQVISSKDNEIIKNIKKLKEKKYRDLENAYLIEGIKIVKEAIAENAKIKQIVMCEDFTDNVELDKDTLYELARHNLIYVTRNIMDSLSDVKTPQGIIGVVEKSKRFAEEDNDENKSKNNIDAETNMLGNKTGIEPKVDYTQDIIIALDGVQDPGNLGTIIRTADSANLNQIIISKTSADPYNPKVVRSTMGAIFRVNIIETENIVEELKKAQENGFKVMVTALDSSESIYKTEFNKKVIVIGNEANGVSKEVQSIADEKVKIPMLGKTESLNASVAAGIMIYEYVRRKIKE